MFPELVERLSCSKRNIYINLIPFDFIGSHYCLSIKDNNMVVIQFVNVK